VLSALNLILQAPARWPIRHRTHRYVLRGFPYTIAYRLSANDVVIIAVAHHRLEPSDWENR
jgi:hypothetical protein